MCLSTILLALAEAFAAKSLGGVYTHCQLGVVCNSMLAFLRFASRVTALFTALAGAKLVKASDYWLLIQQWERELSVAACTAVLAAVV